MSDLVITSRPLLSDLLEQIGPYVRAKREHVRRAGLLLPRLAKISDCQVFLQLAREVDAFSALNYSKTKQISAVDVEQHLRSKGLLCPRNDFLVSYDEEMASLVHLGLADPRGSHNTPAPRNRVKV
jgi:hypothetical protein